MFSKPLPPESPKQPTIQLASRDAPDDFKEVTVRIELIDSVITVNKFSNFANFV